ncbi:hypothetical protein [Tomitella biformata]|nr:hypothetical protein [Tomitella biformata]
MRVHNLPVSVNGYSAGPDQNEDRPLGRGGERLLENLGTGADGY